MQHGIKKTFEVSGETQVVDNVVQAPPPEGFRFGRIFGNLFPFKPTDASLEDLGSAMTTPTLSEDSNIPAGYTYFGQFIDHDITRDETANLPTDIIDTLTPDQIKQKRSPTLDLDSLYGEPKISETLKTNEGLDLRLGTTSGIAIGSGIPTGSGAENDFPDHDVPRDGATSVATIGDSRNDENLIIQQLHTAFLNFHNRTADILRAAAPPTQSNAAIFAETRDLIVRHYQWLVLNDFVRRIVAPDIFQSVLGETHLQGVRSISPKPLVFKISAQQIPPMPLEFSVAAYRMGHSMIRDGYSWNKIFNSEVTPFRFFFIFTQLSGDIEAGGRFPSNWIADWRRMFPFEDVAGFQEFERGGDLSVGQIPLNFAKRIDTSIAEILGNLPKGGGNLASRNLIRGSRNGLPSGQDVAAEIIRSGDAETTILSPDEILAGLTDAKLTAVRDAEFHIKSPLWFYILREAELAGGDHLGRVGSRIVVETFLALIRCSLSSVFAPDPDRPGNLLLFSPEDSPLRTEGGEPLLTMAHLLAFVGGVNPLGDTMP